MNRDRRLAWWLMWSYPPRFRRDVGLGLVDALEDRMRARRAEGTPAAAIWLRACADTLRNASAEWMDVVGEVLKGVPYTRAADTNGRRGWSSDHPAATPDDCRGRPSGRPTRGR